MGLDQYLTATKHIARYQHDPEGTEIADRVLEAVDLADLQEDQASVEVKVTAMYWRKANHIHRWFVENAQNGVDDCGTYYVSVEQLQILLTLCRRVLAECPLEDGGTIKMGTTYYPDGRVIADTREGRVVANPEHAEALLPTTSGFFFGSTAYDEYYIGDVQYTADRLAQVLDIANDKGVWFEYHSSW